VISGPETTGDNNTAPSALTSKSIDWYAEGQSRIVEIDGVRVTVKLIGRKGRRSRILIEASPGAEFRDG